MTVTRAQIRRIGGASAVLFVILGAVAVVLPGSPPKADEVLKITPYLFDKRDNILAGNYIAGVGFAFFLIFLAALRETFGSRGADGVRPGVISLVGGVMAITMIFVANAVFNAAVFQPTRDVALNHALYDLANDLFFMSGFGFAVFFVGAMMAIRATGALPSWLGPFAVVAGLLNLVSPIGLFVKTGFFAIGGAFGFVVPVVSLLWVLVAGVYMLRGEPDEVSISRSEPVATS